MRPWGAAEDAVHTSTKSVCCSSVKWEVNAPRKLTLVESQTEAESTYDQEDALS